MQAIILAAGMGNRLGSSADNKPKSLMEFGAISLMQRHIKLLKQNGIQDITIVVGYQAEVIQSHLQTENNLHFILNPRFQEGSLISLAYAKDIMVRDENMILMDADVLYHPDILKRLIKSTHENCLLIDKDFIPGDEPVKVCIDSNGHINEFRKKVDASLKFETQGESVGFFKFNRDIAQMMIDKIDDYLELDDSSIPYEDAIRDCLLEAPEKFSVEDITSLAWIEIDFPEDITRAQNEILPNI